eukprot:CAMPEP_0119006024 /NCGR_PEP_ID=MMETSP1176-20130426/2075_1 /TAXON_ID=265551 /ORGANISM="Synedropsis recta cf, Strain CCMP1620" /LENGTH=236 /DNA_ID=CAMNT_0006957911 /DNA_START=46 /DNA_END=756 /DNA_ORIENTATION=-
MSHHRMHTVHFQDKPELVPPISPELLSGLVNASWWSGEEFQRFRMSYQMMAQGIRCRHEAAASNPSSYTNVLCSTYQSCVDGRSPSEDNLKQLAGWMEMGTSRLGLESLSVKTIKNERREASRRAIKSVLEAQTDKTGLGGIDAEKIRRVYQKVTESARLFAIALADAAELATTQDDKNVLNEMPSSIFSPNISNTSFRFKMQRRLLFDNLHHPPSAEQLNLPLWRRDSMETASPI